MIFFEFAHATAPIQALAVPLIVMGQHPSTGKFVHFKRAGEPHHYFGHTDDAAMQVFGRALVQMHVPFRQITERELPMRKRTELAALRLAGHLG